jgi:biopolymer transport protein ExbB
MKKLIALVAIIGVLTISFSSVVYPQTTDTTAQQTLAGQSSGTLAAAPEKTATWHQVLKEKFIQGGAGFNQHQEVD